MLRRSSLCILFVSLLLAAAPAAPPEGNWLLYAVSPAGANAQCLLKLRMEDGKPVLEVVQAQQNVEASVSQVELRGNELSFKLKQVRNVQGRSIPTEQTFVGVLGSDPKVMLGSLGDDRFTTRAKLVTTDNDEITPTDRFVRAEPVAPYQEALQLNARASQLMFQMQREQDAEKKQELQPQVIRARQEAEEKAPALYREVIEKHADSPAAFDAGLALVRLRVGPKLTPEEAAKVVRVMKAQAEPYGPRFVRSQMTMVAELLSGREGMETVALEVVEPIVKSMPDSEKAAMQVRLLSVFRDGLEKAGRTEELKAVNDRLAGLEAKLDEEYLATVPPFKPTPYTGRKHKEANQPVVMELFTGAQCPPCVAADVAFDALENAYSPKDLILIQYHMHIPGPDPLTSPACIARWDYYRTKHAQQVRGTPSTLFNGTPAAGGGGGMANAESKFNQYREVIDALLEQITPVGLTGKATRRGDVIEISAEVTGAVPKGEDLRLRFVLVEEKVRYVGGNGLRFHHQVVRAMPGGPEGVAITESNFRHVATADLGAVRKELTAYLDDYQKQRPFPNKARPMELAHLKVIALVQSDDDQKILQAAMFDVEQK